MTQQLNARSQEFKDKLFALLREYDVEMEVTEDSSGYQSYATGVNFFAYTQYDENGEVAVDCIDFDIGTWENGK